MSELFAQLYQLLLPTVLSAISTVLGVLLIRLSAVAKERWGIEIEARHREALQSALMTGVSKALSRGLTGDQAVQAAVEHVMTDGAPDAVAKFGLTLGKVASMARAKLHEAARGAPPVAGGVIANPKHFGFAGPKS